MSNRILPAFILLLFGLQTMSCTAASQDDAVSEKQSAFRVDALDNVDIDLLFFTEPRKVLGESFVFYETSQEHRNNDGNFKNFGILLIGYQEIEERPMGLKLWVDRTQFESINFQICLSVSRRPDVEISPDAVHFSRGLHERLEIRVSNFNACVDAAGEPAGAAVSVSLDNNREVKVDDVRVGKIYYGFEGEKK